MTYKARRTNERPEHRDPGTWKELTLSNGEISATFTCPTCSVYADLDEHEIKSTGEVYPSVLCPNECGFHEFVVLEGWLGINGAHLTNIM